MNLRRGFFRIWLVLSALYVIAVGALFYSDVSGRFQKAALGAEFKKAGAGILLVPVLCKEARGKDGEDYDSSGPWNEYRTEKLCWYQEPSFRKLYPEYKDLTEDDLSARLYQRAGLKIERAQPWTLLGTAAAMALSVPLAVLILGAAVGWAFSGFAASKRSEAKNG